MKKKYWLLGALGLVLALGTAGCGDDSPSTDGDGGKFTFTVKLASGNTNLALEVGSEDKIVITASNEPEDAHYTFEPVGSAGDYISVLSDGTIKAEHPTPDKVKARVSIKETNHNVGPLYMSFTVYDTVVLAEGGKNWASNVTKREEILGKLEEYAMSNYLTGIALFENAGYTRFSSRVKPGTYNYITGYGLGVISEGELDKSISLKTNDKYPSYYHTGTSSDPATVNGWDAQGSDVSDLFSYMSASYWGTKMNSSKNGYDWYPLLARDTIKDKDDKVVANNRPIHQDPDNALGLYRKWRIYVKTGASSEGGIKYSYSGNLNEHKNLYNGREVALEDYETVLMAMLTQKSNVFRGGELAGDTTYGIKGAQAYYNRTGKNNSNPKKEWDTMKSKGELGIATGTDPKNGSYIEFELINPIDDFTAMYTLSSNLYTPIPLDFLDEIGDNDFTKGIKVFGTFNGQEADSAILDYSLSLGAFFLEDWTKGREMVFGRNNSWYECDGTRYKIEGIHMRYFKEAASDPDYIYKQFSQGEILDVTGIPSVRMGEKLPTDIPSKGDSTFKLNVNSCSQARWNELFGTNGTNNNTANPKQDDYYKCKPWMSNINFLNGLYWSINRAEFADAQGVTPSFNYFSDSYLSDPQKGISYNSTETHEKAVSKFHNVQKDSQGNIIGDDYGYNFGTAKAYFKQAVEELTKSGDLVYGTKENPTIINISIGWMYESDIKQYGNKIVKYFTDAFNHKDVCGERIKLVIDAVDREHYAEGQFAVTKWDDIYSQHLQIGCYDLAFGAISGNTYSPLNFLEVLKSDNSSSFTLNWGVDTSKVDEKNPIIYDGQSWSFDALWAAADHGTVTEGGRNVNPAKHNYLSNPKDASGNNRDNVYLGATFTINFEFVGVKGVELEITDVRIYLTGVGSLAIQGVDKQKNADGTYTITFTLSPDTAASYDKQIYDANNLDKQINEHPELAHPFVYGNYDQYWNIEVYYTMTLLGGSPSQIIDNTAMDIAADAKR